MEERIARLEAMAGGERNLVTSPSMLLPSLGFEFQYLLLLRQRPSE
jgi:hypothetical protein